MPVRHDQARECGTAPVGVEPRQFVAADRGEPGQDAAGQVRVGGVHPGVEDRDHDAVTVGVLLRLLDVQVPQVPLGIADAVGEGGRGGDHRRDRRRGDREGRRRQPPTHDAPHVGRTESSTSSTTWSYCRWVPGMDT